MSGVDLYGDEVHFDGYLVAILVQSGVPATVMATFTDELENGLLDEDVCCRECGAEAVVPHRDDCSEYDDAPEGCGTEEEGDVDYVAALTDTWTSLFPFVKGGLVKWTDVMNVLTQLKEESEIE
jgi:hypothetical protein